MDAENPAEATEFMAFLLSEEASVFFTEHGFTPIGR
jgi:ABC-type molybdate transport system substrate-binding protein